MCEKEAVSLQSGCIKTRYDLGKKENLSLRVLQWLARSNRKGNRAMQEMTFVRKDFYIDPPTRNASVEEWNTWIKADSRKASAAKAQFTKSLDFAEVPEEFQEGSVRKVNGRWQQVAAVGFSGDVEEGTCTVEPIVESVQEQQIILARMEKNRNVRGGSRAGKSARRRANKKKRK